MASISHLAAGALCGAVYARYAPASPVRTIPAFALLALSPDLDFLALEMGLSGTPLGHRVMTHSLPFALLVGSMVGAFVPAGRRALASVLGVAALASHGLLDAMTINAPGPQLLWPFSTAAIEFAWRPIPGTQFYQQYFTAAAIPVLSREALACIPFLVVAVWVLVRDTRCPRSDI